MAENGTTDTNAANGEPAPLVNADGVLRENWRDSLPEEIRDETVFDRVKDFSGAMKSLASAERMIGKDKIAIPTESSGDDEWDAFYRAGGRPEMAEEYGLVRPEELPEEMWSDERAAKYMKLFHETGLNKKQVERIVAEYNTDVLQQLKDQAIADELAMDELKNGLLSDWGNAYETKKHLGNVAIEQGVDGDIDFKKRLTQKLGNDPDFIRFVSNLGSKFAESSAIDVKLGAPVPGELDNKIQEITASDAYNNKKHPGHKNAVIMLTKLYVEKNVSTGKPI